MLRMVKKLNRIRLFYFLIAASLLAISGPLSASAADVWEDITPPEASGHSFSTIRAIGDDIYLGTDGGIFVSSDGGSTWSEASSGLSDQDVRAIDLGWSFDGSVFVIAADDPIIAGTAGGIFTSGFGSTTWTPAVTGPTSTVHDIEFDQNESVAGVPTHAYAATDEGVYRTDDAGVNWTLQDTGMEGLAVRKIMTDFTNGLVYALTSSGDIYSSVPISLTTDDESWSLARESEGESIHDISLLNAMGAIHWLSSAGSILKSDGTDTEWNDISDGLGGGDVHMVESDFYESNIAYAATEEGIYRTTDEALSSPHWLPIGKNLDPMDILEVRANASDSLSVFAISSTSAYSMILSDAYIDLTPPSAISDLSTLAIGSSTVSLFWTSPGEDGIYGTTTSYIIKYATSTITEGNWNEAATSTDGVPTPDGYGEEENHSFVLPDAGETYYFAIKSVDDAGNESDISNVASITLDGDAPNVTVSSPSGAFSSGTSETTLSASTDESATCRFSTSSGTSFASMTAFSSTGGTSHTHTISGLSSGSSYTYYVRCQDDYGNVSPETSASFSVNSPTSSSGRSRGRGGGGGGGGSSSRVPTSVPGQGVTVAPASGGISIQALVELLIAIGAIAPDKISAARAFAGSSGVLVSAPPAASGSLAMNLYYGLNNAQVRTLQRLLGSKGYLVTPPGEETTYFGPATLSAVKRFQCAHLNICSGDPNSTGYGFVGPLTRQALASF